jgi:hypothetical protein
MFFKIVACFFLARCDNLTCRMLHHWKVRQCHFLLRFKGATTFVRGKNEEILEASRREVLMMSCLLIGLDLTRLS